MPQVFRRRLERPFSVDAVRQLREDHLAACEAAGIQGPQCWELVSVADELASNVVEHGQASWLEVRLAKEGERLWLQVNDDGREFDTVAEAAKRGGDVVTGTERGIGLFLVNRMSKSMSYTRVDPGRNELSILPGRKGLSAQGGKSWKN